MTRTLACTFTLLAGLLIALSAFADDPPAEPGAQSPTEPTAELPTPNLFMLDAEQPAPGPQFCHGILLRELGRQAVLIAARDELGLPTRDAALREPFITPANPRLGPLTIRTTATPGQHYRIELAPVNNHKAILRLPDMPFAQGEAEQPFNWLAILQSAELWSRTHMPKTLRRIGYQPSPNPEPNDAALPDEVLADLNDMNFIAQFMAVRHTHQLIRQHGQSPQLLGALVRGYANLGVLTDDFWTNTSKTFKARALLYAQRMVAGSPDSPIALSHRAYAFALAGLQRFALDDLAAAQGATDDLPPWTAVIDAYCRYDYPALMTTAQQAGPDAAPAGLLATLSVAEDGEPQLIVQAADATLAVAPHCVRVIDVMADYGGVQLGHRATVLGPETLATAMFNHLPAISDLPEPVVKHLRSSYEPYRRAQHRAKIAQALNLAADTTIDPFDLSWAVLGQMIHDVNFVHIYRRLYFIKHTWGLDSDEVTRFAQSMLPVVADHPFATVVKSFGINSVIEPGRFSDCFDQLDTTNASFAVDRLFKYDAYDLTYEQHHPGLQALRDVMYDNADFIDRDIITIMNNWRKPKYNLYYAPRLQAVSPHSPLAAATILVNDWDNLQDEIDDLVQRYGHQVVFIRTVAPMLFTHDRDDQAIALLERYAATCRSAWPYKRLAQIYLDRGDEDKWLEMMEQVLQTPDYALQHTRVEVDIAEHLMADGRFERALPYAESAANSWAAWAMLCAATCNEAVGNWDRAELWVRRTSERYESSRQAWYFWCLRTGYGDRKAAEQLIPIHLSAMSNPEPGTTYLPDFAWHQLFCDQPDRGLEFMDRAYTDLDDFWTGIAAMVIANQLGNTHARDDLVTRLIQQLEREKKAQPTIQWLQHFQQYWAQDAEPFDAAVIDQLLADYARDYRSYVDVVIAGCLYAEQKPQQASERLANVLRSHARIDTDFYRLAWYIAQQNGADPYAIRNWPGDAHPPRRTSAPPTQSASPPPPPHTAPPPAPR